MNKNETNKKFTIEVCHGITCQSKGAEGIYKYIKENIDNSKAEVIPDRCLGECSNGPNIVYNNKIHNNQTIDDIKTILNK